MHAIKIALLLVSTALAGCLNAPTPTATPEPVKIPVSDAGPGTGRMNPIEATNMFNQICVETAPKFTNARRVIASMPFTQHPKTGTYFHRKLNLSFKLTSGKVCSMVFGPTDNSDGTYNPDGIGVLMSAMVGGGDITISPAANNAVRVTSILPSGERMVFQPVPVRGHNLYSAAIKSKR